MHNLLREKIQLLEVDDSPFRGNSSYSIREETHSDPPYHTDFTFILFLVWLLQKPSVDNTHSPLQSDMAIKTISL